MSVSPVSTLPEPAIPAAVPTPLGPAAVIRPRTGADRLAAHALAGEVARLHGDALLRTARKVSWCADDAHDAYQRALELLLQHAAGIDRAKAVGWMHVVVRREALAIRKQRGRAVSFDEQHEEPAGGRTPDDRLDAIDVARRAGEALATLKEAEAQALCMRAQGMSYAEIGEHYGWSYTKVNRAVTEGRRAFVDHYAALERGEICTETGELVERFAAGELRPRQAVRVRAHLARCSACRTLLHAERGADRALHALLPPAAAATPVAGGWLDDRLLAPLGHLLGRLQPATEPLLSAKAGVAVASTIAIAGGGVAAERELAERPAPEPLRGGVIAPPRPASAPPAGVQAVIAGGAQRGAVIADRAEQAARAAARRKARSQARAEARERQAQRANHDFSVAGGEFAGGGAGATQAAGAARRSGTTGAAPAPDAAPPDPETVVAGDDGGGGTSTDIVVGADGP